MVPAPKGLIADVGLYGAKIKLPTRMCGLYYYGKPQPQVAENYLMYVIVQTHVDLVHLIKNEPFLCEIRANTFE